MPIRSASILLNLSSGRLLGDRGERATRRLERMVREAGLEAEILPVPPRHLESAIRKAAKSGTEAVMVAGGDGTLRTAARILAFHDKPLGILPLGTRNRMSRALGIPDNPQEALRALAAGKVRPADIGRSRVFAVTNNPFTPAGMGGQPHLETLDSGKLGLYMSRHQGRMGLIRLVGELVMGKWDVDPQVIQIVVPELTIRMGGNAPVEIMNDGEFLRLDAPLYYRARPGALRIVVPVEWQEARAEPDRSALAANATPAPADLVLARRDGPALT